MCYPGLPTQLPCLLRDPRGGRVPHAAMTALVAVGAAWLLRGGTTPDAVEAASGDAAGRRRRHDAPVRRVGRRRQTRGRRGDGPQSAMRSGRAWRRAGINAATDGSMSVGVGVRASGWNRAMPERT